LKGRNNEVASINYPLSDNNKKIFESIIGISNGSSQNIKVLFVGNVTNSIKHRGKTNEMAAVLFDQVLPLTNININRFRRIPTNMNQMIRWAWDPRHGWKKDLIDKRLSVR